jgi:hypothetical protein
LTLVRGEAYHPRHGVRVPPPLTRPRPGGARMARFSSTRRLLVALAMAALMTAATAVQVFAGPGAPPFPR